MNLCRCEKGHFYDKEKYATCPHCAGGSAADNSLTEAFSEDVTSAASQPLPQPNRFDNTPDFIQRPQNDTEPYDPDGFPVPGNFADEKTEAFYTSPVNSYPGDSPTVPLNFPTIPAGNGMDDDDHTIGIYDDFFTNTSPVDNRVNSPGRTPAVNKVSTPCVGWLIALGGEHIGTDFRLKTGKNFIGRGSQMDVALTEDKSVSRDRHAIVVYEPKAHLYLVQPGESSSLVYKNDEVVLTPVKLEPYDVITVGDVNLLFMPLCGARFNWGDLFKKMKNDED